MLITSIGFNEDNMQVLTVTDTLTGQVIEILVLRALKKFTGDIFSHVNAYQATLPESVNRELMRLFSYIQDELDRDHKSVDTTDKLTEVIHQLVKVYDFERFLKWFRQNSDDVFLSEKTKEEFVYDPDETIVKEKTYIVRDYIDLVGLSTFVRGLMPGYLQQLAYYIEAKNQYPYFNIYKLFIGCDFDTGEGPLEKLRVFIDTNFRDIFGNTKSDDRVLGSGLAEDDVVDYLIGIELFEKLLPLDFVESKSNGVSRIHSSVIKDGGFETNSTRHFKSKFKSKDDSGDGDIRARLECYQLVTELAMDDIVFIEHNIKGIILDPDNFDYVAFEKEKENMSKFLETKIHSLKLELLGCLLKDIVDPSALQLDIDQRTIVELLLMAKTHLMKTEHTFIGMLLGSVVDDNPNLMNSGASVKGTISPKLTRELEEMYTYTVLGPNGKSVVVNDIVEKSNIIVDHAWRSYGAYDGRYINQEGLLIPPPDVNECLVNFVKYIY